MSETGGLLSRFQLYPSPIVPPGKCAVCGSVERPVIDFGMTLEYYGAVLICVECMTEAAERFGMVPRSALTELEGRLSLSISEHLSQRSLRVITDEQYNTLVGSLGGLVDDLRWSDNAYLADEPDKPETSDREPEIDDASAVGTTEQDDESIVIEGPASLSSDSSDGSSFEF